MAVKSSSDVRAVYRGTVHRFEASFFEDDAQTTPIVPEDNTKYPTYTIYDVANNAISTGIGTLITSGNYYSRWSCPEEAVLSSDDRMYRIEWAMLDSNSRQFNFVQEFNVVDEIIETSANHEQVLHNLVNKPYVFTYKTKTIPHEITLDVFFGQNQDNKVVDGVQKSTGEIQMRTQDEWQVWYYSVEENILNQNGCYTVLWTVNESEISVPVNDFQILNNLDAAALQFIPHVRMVIDKMQKKLSTIQAYQDSDIVEYLNRGIQFINAWFPVTYYDITNMPSALHTALVMSASWYGLNAQHLLEVELQYDFSGQIDSFSFDHASGLESALGRIWDYFTTTLAQTKTQIFRTSHRVGTGANRLQSLRGGYNQNIVFPLNRQGTPSLLSGNFVAFFGL